MIYILDDEIHTCELVSYLLNSSGYKTQFFQTPSDFWAKIKTTVPDMVILDVMLPEEDGISIIQKIREDAVLYEVPVIMLTAKDLELDKVRGLDFGADDYITKPFSAMEFLSRVKTVLRRTKKSEDELITCYGITIETARHRVSVGGEYIHLAPKEYALLLYMMKNKGIAIPRERLITAIWEYSSHAEDRVVDIQIHNLRKKLGDAGTFIQSVRGVGYRLGELESE